jgi:polyisoprenoid-binding protein YceI
MKQRPFSILALAALMGLAACTDAPESDKATTGEAQTAADTTTGEAWTVDTTQSRLEWIGTKVSGYHSGSVPIKAGTLTVNNGALTAGRFTMDMANMVVTGPKGSDATGNTKLLGHLKSGDFFDVTAHPEATFELTGVQPFSGTVQDSADARQEDISEYRVANPTHTISGNLTIKGTTKNVQFPARVTVSGNQLDALAKFNIDRREWNITYPGQPDDLIRDEIHIGIAIKASK